MPVFYSLVFVAGLIAGVFGYQPPKSEPTFSAALPAATAVFETSLASPITSSATSMTLTANSVRGGGSISGYACFTIDEGSAQAEFVCGTVSSTAVSSMTRGISPLTGTTTDTDLQFAHRRGANVKITDFPLIQILKAQANGQDTFPNPLSYATASTTILNPEHVATKAYVDYVAFNGASVVDASATTKGVVELATQAESAASTGSGAVGPLVIANSTATSTYNAATAALRVLMSGAGGKLDNNFIASTTLFGYTLPNPIGASSTVLSSDGTNAVYAKTWTLMFATTTQQAMPFATTTLPTADYLKVVFEVPRTPLVPAWRCQLNGDGSTNYGYVHNEFGTNTPVRSSSATFVGLADTLTLSTTTNMNVEIDIYNPATRAKSGTFDFLTTAGTSSPTHYQGSFGWNNTSEKATSLSCGRSDSSVPAGTVIRVYGY